MKAILVPGLWLDASSWDAVLPALERAGHDARPLTLPGVGASGAESADIGIADWVGTVVAEIDAADAPVALVGHSGGGNVVWGAADARPDRVARVVFVDTFPPPPGADISEFELVDGVVPFPGWQAFDDAETFDLDEPTRQRMAASALAVPARVPTDAIALSNPGRSAVPVTILAGMVSPDEVDDMLAAWGRFADEYRALADVEVIRLDSGHWPQFSQPDRLAAALVDALRGQ